MLTNNSPPVPPLDESVAVSFSPREAQVLELLKQGLTNRQIALRLGISYLTVKVHLHHIYTKLGVDNRVAVILWLVEHRHSDNGNGHSESSNSKIQIPKD